MAREREIFDLRFALPSECADQLASGDADIGIVPVIEMARQKLEYFRGTGIACHGPVRSILLISKVPFREIRTLATDSGSRTSVMLARVILAEKFGVEPKLISRLADLTHDAGRSRRGAADRRCGAARRPGEAAVRNARPGRRMDGHDRAAHGVRGVERAQGSARNVTRGRSSIPVEFGLAHMDDIVRLGIRRGFDPALVRKYLTEHIVFELGEHDYAGLDLFLKKRRALSRRCSRLEFSA